MPFGRWFIFAIFGGAAVGAVALLTSTLSGAADTPGIPFTVLWLGAVAWNAYWWLLRFAADITLDGDYLRWAAPLRRGELRLDELTEIRPMRLASNVAVIEAADNRRVLVLATKGIRAFTDEISRRRPELPVRLGWQARFAERMPGRSAFRRSRRDHR